MKWDGRHSPFYYWFHENGSRRLSPPHPQFRMLQSQSLRRRQKSGDNSVRSRRKKKKKTDREEAVNRKKKRKKKGSAGHNCTDRIHLWPAALIYSLRGKIGVWWPSACFKDLRPSQWSHGVDLNYFFESMNCSSKTDDDDVAEMTKTCFSLHGNYAASAVFLMKMFTVWKKK